MVIVVPLVIYLVVFVALFLAYRRMRRRFRAQINGECSSMWPITSKYIFLKCSSQFFFE